MNVVIEIGKQNKTDLIRFDRSKRALTNPNPIQSSTNARGAYNVLAVLDNEHTEGPFSRHTDIIRIYRSMDIPSSESSETIESYKRSTPIHTKLQKIRKYITPLTTRYEFHYLLQIILNLVAYWYNQCILLPILDGILVDQYILLLSSDDILVGQYILLRLSKDIFVDQYILLRLTDDILFDQQYILLPTGQTYWSPNTHCCACAMTYCSMY